KLAEGIKADITKNFTAAVELFEPTADEDVPRAFENNGFIEPVEGITSDYAMPSSHDVDPNPIMAFFYYFFFGMMFSDAGYGLLMMIACGLLGYGNFLEKGKRRAYKMFFFCGVSTTFWGLMYGSFFGDMIATVSKTFGNGTLALKPILMDPVQKPLDLLIMSVAFGLVHMLTALAVKFYMTWRSGEKLAAVFDTGFWFTLLSGIGIFAAGMGLGISVLQTVGLVMMIGSAAGLILTQGRDKKNPIMKVFGGILSLYDITSYVGDALSYSRLMALGLATGVIASVINVLGSLGGGSVVGLIAFILISVFGHSLNFAINMLGAYVHTNRLQYVEFYQKFYEGGGRKYKPFGFNTKYYLFKNRT
ncbi:MAG: V-type ATP synthase subunit I, partial [Clostridia bacterium]|nr:V-type ATP synthase subunit I [Clostridia bacterium]